MNKSWTLNWNDDIDKQLSYDTIVHKCNIPPLKRRQNKRWFLGKWFQSNGHHSFDSLGEDIDHAARSPETCQGGDSLLRRRQLLLIDNLGIKGSAGAIATSQPIKCGIIIICSLCLANRQGSGCGASWRRHGSAAADGIGRKCECFCKGYWNS